MAVGIGDDFKPQRKHLREGFGQPNNLFLTNFSLYPSVNFLTFFDYGCPACYVTLSLAKKLAHYISEFSSTIAGIVGRGPRITHDAIIKAQFYLSTKLDNKWSSSITVSVDVTPDNTFSGDLTLGQTMFHALGLQCRKNGSIQLLGIPYKPILHPVQSDTFTNYSFISTTLSPISWHKLISSEGIRRGNIYASKFPSLFNKNLQKLTKYSRLAIESTLKTKLLLKYLLAVIVQTNCKSSESFVRLTKVQLFKRVKGHGQPP